MKILIIGGSGHVSGAVARAALAGGNQVWAITRGRKALPAGVKALAADRNDSQAMEKAVSSQGGAWDLVVDCICYDLPQMQQDITLFRERAGYFVFISTDFVYDPARREFPQPEEAEFYVADGEGSYNYGYKKRLCEVELINRDTGGMKWGIVRPCHVYGPTSLLGCLPRHGRDAELINRLRAGETLKLVGGGHFLQQPVFADDLAKTVISFAANDQAAGKVFNTAGPEIIESRQYYQIIADLLGVELKVEEVPVSVYLAENPGQGPFLCHRTYDLQALKDCGLELPSTSMEKGLRLHVEGLLGKGK